MSKYGFLFHFGFRIGGKFLEEFENLGLVRMMKKFTRQILFCVSLGHKKNADVNSLTITTVFVISFLSHYFDIEIIRGLSKLCINDIWS